MKTITACLIGFCIGFFGGVSIKFIYESTAFQPYSWEDNPPTIVNCYGPNYSKLQMIRAIDFWTIRGHNIGYYEHNPPDSICKHMYIEGFIILRDGGKHEMEVHTLAKTRRWTSFGNVKAAVITYKSGSQNLQWINEHELGHALGYAHVEEDGHIMHPLYHKMKGKFWIP